MCARSWTIIVNFFSMLILCICIMFKSRRFHYLYKKILKFANDGIQNLEKKMCKKEKKLNHFWQDLIENQAFLSRHWSINNAFYALLRTIHNSKVCMHNSYNPQICAMCCFFVHSLLHFFGKSSRLNSFAIPLLSSVFFHIFFFYLSCLLLCALYFCLCFLCYVLLRFAFQTNFWCYTFSFYLKNYITRYIFLLHLCLKSIFYRSFVVVAIYVKGMAYSYRKWCSP